MLHVSLRQLEYVVAVGKAGSLSTASSLLNVSQPALSVAISQVERHVGEVLFLRRKGAATTLTAFGRLFVQEAEALLAQAAQLEQPGALSRKTQTRLAVGILDELAPRWLAPILGLLRREFPQVEARTRALTFERLNEGLLSGQIDMGLTYDLGLDASFHRDPLVLASPWIWVAPQDDLAAHPSVTLADIADRPLILSDQDLSFQHMIGLFRGIGVTPIVRHRASSIELLRSLAAHGEGTGLSYTTPTGALTYGGKPVASVRIRDTIAIAPVVLAHAGAQPAPLPAVRTAIQALAQRTANPV